MHYVYILQSTIEQKHFYVGSTNNLKRRLEEHNTGQSPHTKKFMPWEIKTYIAFNNEQKAKDFESFLKTGNGRQFAKKRL